MDNIKKFIFDTSLGKYTFYIGIHPGILVLNNNGNGCKSFYIPKYKNLVYVSCENIKENYCFNIFGYSESDHIIYTAVSIMINTKNKKIYRI